MSSDWRHSRNSACEQKPPNSDADTNKQPQKTNTPTGDEITDTGPHGIDKTPPTVPPPAQSKKASDVASGQSSDKANNGLGHKMAAGVGNQIQKGAKSIKEAPGKMLNKIKSNLQSDRSRKKKLKKERNRLGTELASLDGKIDKMKSSWAMRIIRRICPPVYNWLTTMSFGKANAKDSVKIKILQTNLITLRTIKVTLQAVKAGLYLMIIIQVILIPFLLIPVVDVAIGIIIEWLGRTVKSGDAAITLILKEINPMIEKIEDLIKPLKKKVQIRKRIVQINQLLSATKAERKEDAAIPKEPANDTSPKKLTNKKTA